MVKVLEASRLQKEFLFELSGWVARQQEVGFGW